METDLREQLKYMGRHVSVPEHPDFLERLREAFCHEIVVDHTASLNPDYRCFTYALGLHDPSVWPELQRDTEAVNTNWVEALIERGVLRATPTPTLGDVVVYFRCDRPFHAGIWVGRNRVRSKWGLGWVYEHGVLEVPSHYGDVVVVYAKPLVDEVIRDFRRHIKTSARYWFGTNDDDDGWA